MLSPKRAKVAVVGELNVDLVATDLRNRPEFGREVLARGFDVVLGSASAIFACGLARLGHDVTFVSKVGRDAFGDFCVRALREAGLSTASVRRDAKLRTGVTISLSTKRDRMLVTYLGAIAEMEFDEMPFARLKGHRHIHLTSYFLQTGIQRRVPEIFERAKAMGLSTSFDPNTDPSGRWRKAIRKVFERTDVLFVNETEASEITGKRNPADAARTLAEVVPVVVVKLGPRGAVAMAEGRIARAPGFKVKTVDTTGAGDTFAAGFVAARLEGRDLDECLRFANACGALSTMKPGGTVNQPDRATLSKFLEERR